jgi:DNA modification methylase
MAFVENEELDFTVNKLILGDNLEILKTIPEETIDLIYLDPPFFSNRNYEVIWGDEGEIRSFKDRWAGGIDHYIGWLYERVEQMHRILKPTGSIYLHCDWHADAYIRVNILDKIFGMNNFIADIIWYYSWGGRTFKRWNRKHDVIYQYSKTNSFTFNVNEVLDERILTDASRKRLEYSGAMIMKNAGTKADPNFIPPSDVWYIATINAMSKERIGYPTQKPEALLERLNSIGLPTTRNLYGELIRIQEIR